MPVHAKLCFAIRPSLRELVQQDVGNRRRRSLHSIKKGEDEIAFTFFEKEQWSYFTNIIFLTDVVWPTCSL
jgi:hypothetical protein